jgi:hypothetical protein
MDPALDFRDPKASELDELVKEIDRLLDVSFLEELGLALDRARIEPEPDPG